jgi:hypothetical protein
LGKNTMMIMFIFISRNSENTLKATLYIYIIYIHILIYDLIAQKQSFHSVSVTLRWVPCPS